MRWRRLVPLLLVTFLATPVGALTCAPPDLTTSELVAADLESPRGRYDLAVVGQVIGITTNLEPGEEYGQTAVHLTVIGAYGGRLSEPDLVAFTPDPGWNAGIDFEQGASYFVPLAMGPEGEPNYVTACDPVERLSDAEGTAFDLATTADSNGVEYSFPMTESGSGTSTTVVVLAVLVLLLLWTGSLRRSSRRQLNAPDSDLRRPPGPRR